MTAMTLEQAVAHVTANEPAFEVTNAQIRGVTYRVFKNIPPTVGALLRASIPPQNNGSAEYLVFEDERWTFNEFCADVQTMAHVLRHDFGIRKGDRVALAMRNYPELLILLMAITSVESKIEISDLVVSFLGLNGEE